MIEHGVLINSGSVVDHDSLVGCGAHIGLGSVVRANGEPSSPKRKVEEGKLYFRLEERLMELEKTEIWKMHYTHLVLEHSAVM